MLSSAFLSSKQNKIFGDENPIRALISLRVDY